MKIVLDSKIRRVMWRREERPLTVFAPRDCGHHCPFCTTKLEYETKYPAEKLDYFFNRQKESLRRMLEYGFVDSVVFTGGEPFADIERLDELVSTVRRGKDAESAPWFGKFKGDRINDHHTTLAEKAAAREQ